MRRPLGIPLQGGFQRLLVEFQAACDQSGGSDPDEGAEHGQAQQKTGVSDFVANRQFDQANSNDIKRHGSEQMAVNLPPRSLSAEEQKAKTSRYHQIFDQVSGHIARIEQIRIVFNDFPRHGRKNVDVQPANSEQEQIDETESPSLPHLA